MWGNLLNFGSIWVLCPIGFLGSSGFLFYLLCLLFQCLPTNTPPPPQQLSNHSFLSFGVSFQLFYLYQCLLLLPQLRAGEKNVLSLCSRQIFLLGNGLRRGEKLLYFLLWFSFWPPITEFAVGNGRHRRFCFSQMLVTKMNEDPSSGFCPDMNYLCDVNVNLLNFELFH